MMSTLMLPVHPAPPVPLFEARIDLASGARCGWAALGLGLMAACRQAVRWQAAPVAVPVRHLSLNGVARALDRTGLPPERLEVMLTASCNGLGIGALLEASAVRDLGVGIAVEGFEVSPAMLQRLPLTAVTLDPALVRALPDSPEELELAGAIARMGHALGLTVVARGVETEAQLACLAGLGCDQGQGPVFGPRGVANHSLTCGTARSAPASRHDDEHTCRRAGLPDAGPRDAGLRYH